MREFMNVVKALAEEHRVRILCMLSERELCVCQIIEVLELAPSTVSKHLSILYQAGLIDSTKKGRWVYYSLVPEEALPRVYAAYRWIFESTANDPQIKTDNKKLQQIIRMDPEELCKLQAVKC